MKVIMAAVMSLDGKITQGANPRVRDWASAEDGKMFANLLQKYNLYVMGRKTYEASRQGLDLYNGKRRIVLTMQPELFTKEEAAGALEFSKETPAALCARLASEGYEELLLLGGSEIHTVFLQAGLITELYLTIEPLLLGEGTPLFAPAMLNRSAKLLSTKQLNEQGTLLVHYKIEN